MSKFGWIIFEHSGHTLHLRIKRWKHCSNVSKEILGPRLARGPWHMRTRSRSPGPIPPHPKAASPVPPVIRPAANPFWRLANPPVPVVPPPNGRQVLPFGLQMCSKERAVGLEDGENMLGNE